VPSYRGTLEAAFARALAARRTAAAPHIVQVHEALTDDLIREQLVVPLWRVLADAKEPFAATLLPTVAGVFSDERDRLLALPFTSATAGSLTTTAMRCAARARGPAPATWYGMPPVLEALAASGSACPFTTASPSWALLENLSAWHNQEFVTQDNGFEGAGTRLAFNSRLLVRWTAMLPPGGNPDISCVRIRALRPSRFLAGECAFLTASSASYPRCAGAPSFDLRRRPELPSTTTISTMRRRTRSPRRALWVLAGKAKHARAARGSSPRRR